MLYRVVEAFGGQLPDDVVVTFCNTGKERTETLNFVHECQTRWGVAVRWLEYFSDTTEPLVVYRGKAPETRRHSVREVTYATASRDGEPFEQLIDTLAEFRRAAKEADPVLPNVVHRLCTAQMKKRAMERWVDRELGWAEYTTAVGLRADEPKRVANLMSLNGRKREYVCPLDEDDVDEEAVLDFWRRHEFDLKLESYEGNCDLCFLKAQGKLTRLVGERPELAMWWAKMEARTGQRFRKNRASYQDMIDKRVPLEVCDDEQQTCFCTD